MTTQNFIKWQHKYQITVFSFTISCQPRNLSERTFIPDFSMCQAKIKISKAKMKVTKEMEHYPVTHIMIKIIILRYFLQFYN